uniref:SGNH hydrolase-type esterase domain-containing protein n=1 Tax=Setaria digitata TaxID=48799 RepID=A0A915PQX7_9BILA
MEEERFSQTQLQISGNITAWCTCRHVQVYCSNYIVKVSVKFVDDKVLHGETSMKIRDYWIGVIGDSFASGEGNPDVPANTVDKTMAKWLSNRCHRSSRSWAYKVFERVTSSILEQSAVHFTYLPCTGASVDNGILVVFNSTSQISILEQITLIRGAGPDLLMMSVGGNDIGYSEILSTLIWGPTGSLFSTIDMRFFYTSHQLDRVAIAIQKLKPNQVVIPHYFDLTRNEQGVVDADCADMRQISTENLMLAEKKILQRINRLITKKSKQYGWTAIEGVAELFRSRGCCSSKSLIRSISDSIRLQGNSFGAFHPTEEAHQQIADLVVKQVQQFDN